MLHVKENFKLMIENIDKYHLELGREKVLK